MKDTEANTTSKFTTPANAPVVEKIDIEKEQLKAELHKKIQTILEEHGGMESNIGITHDYWRWMNQIRAMK